MAFTIDPTTNAFPDGQVAVDMREGLETKLLLSSKGSIYVGTGASYLRPEGTGDSIPITEALIPGTNGTLLSANEEATNGLEYVAPSTLTVGNATNAEKIQVTPQEGSVYYGSIVTCTQDQYNSLSPEPTTIYLIIG